MSTIDELNRELLSVKEQCEQLNMEKQDLNQQLQNQEQEKVVSSEFCDLMGTCYVYEIYTFIVGSTPASLLYEVCCV